ncbi:MAG TPA: DUF2891 family protein, partial [Planctomycetes bacterium]|nr:DUF2891 family protein [Planctomycetota bacterium]
MNILTLLRRRATEPEPQRPLDERLTGCFDVRHTPGRDPLMALHGTLRELTELALSCVQQQYPYYIGVVLRSDSDLQLPTQQTPVFNGAFDWHSAVHGHWTLARALHLDGDRTQLGDEHHG